MKYKKKTKIVYTRQDFIDAIAQCETKGDFTNKFPKLYRLLMKKDYGQDLMKSLPRKMKWTQEMLIDEAKKYKTKSEWMRENISSYNTALRDKRTYDLCTAHMSSDFEFGKTIFTYDFCKECYDKYSTMKEIIEFEKPAYNAAVRNGWNDELSKDKEKYSQHRSLKWTYDLIKKEALKYNSIKDFANGNRSAYYKAVYSKWLMDVIGHMDGGYTKWTLEKIVEVLGKYERNEWYKIKECKAPLAYIKRHNLEDELENKLNDIKK